MLYRLSRKRNAVLEASERTKGREVRDGDWRGGIGWTVGAVWDVRSVSFGWHVEDVLRL